METLTLDDLVNLVLFGSIGLFVLLDFIAPARKFPAQSRWRLKAATFTGLYLLIAFTAPAFWDATFAEHQLLDLTSLGHVGGAVVGLLVLQLVSYGYHRALHTVPFLWRIHQMHHSAERVDIWGALYFHPLGALGWTLMGSFALVFLVGVTVEATIAATLATTVVALLGHANLRTPRWLGWFIGRPEMHAVHHERGVHAYNYGDFPLWDMVFGTYRNPATWEERAGFYDGASERMADLLLLRDVNEDSEPMHDGRQSVATPPNR